MSRLSLSAVRIPARQRKSSGAKIALLTAGLLSSTTAARAAVVTLHSEIDLTHFNLNTSVINLTGSPPETTSFAAGDTLKLDVDFRGDQTLKLITAFRFTPMLITYGDTYTAASSIALHDLAGSLTTTSGNFYCCSFGFNFTTPGYAGSGPVEFSGVTFTFANLTFGTNAPADRNASGLLLEIGTYNDGSNGIGHLPAVAPVPEPASWALMLGGFGMVGGALRSRRSPVVSLG